MWRLLLLLILALPASAQLSGAGNLQPCAAGLIPNSTGTSNNCTATAQKFVGTATPGIVPGNLPGDTYSDTSGHKSYWCNAIAGKAAPACTSVGVNGWTLMNTSSAIVPVALTYTSGGNTAFDAGNISAGIGTVTLTHGTTTTLMPANVVSGGTYQVVMSQDSTGGGTTVALGTGSGCSVWTPSGIATSATARATDIVSFKVIGSTCYAVVTNYGAAATGTGALSGSLVTPPATVNLATLGTTDWAHWGLVSASSFDHKSGITALISNFTVAGTGTVTGYADNPTGYTWTSGTPDATATNSTTGVYLPGNGNGFSISAPADTATRILTVYVGVFSAQGRMAAHLSDSSAADLVDTTLNNQVGTTVGAYTFSYHAASSAQQLVVTFTQNDSTGGNVTLQAATLAIAGAPNFLLSASPASQTAAAGASVNYTATVTGSGGFTGTVSLGVSGLPAGASATFTPTTLVGSGTSTMAVNAASAAAGTYPLTITGVSGALSHTAGVSLTISPPVVISGGVTHYSVRANPSWDQYLTSTNPTVVAQLAPIERLTEYLGFGNQFTGRFHTWSYEDIYAIYNPSDIATQHPDWILRDGSGNPLFIPFACGGGTCPQYAGDLGNSAFLNYQLSRGQDAMTAGFIGLWLDDVNVPLDVGDGNGNFVRPIDPRTGIAMTDSAWRGYMASAVAAFHSTIPTAEILINSPWFQVRDLEADSSVLQMMAASKFINLERGFGDSGVGGGAGSFSLTAFMNFIDWAHSQGTAVVAEDVTDTGQATIDFEYSLAGYFLVENDKDYFSSQNIFPPFPASIGYNLGAPSGARTYTASAVGTGHWERSFANGMVILAEPGQGSVTVTLPSPMFNESNTLVTSVTLAQKSGTVLRKSLN